MRGLLWTPQIHRQSNHLSEFCLADVLATTLSCLLCLQRYEAFRNVEELYPRDLGFRYIGKLTEKWEAPRDSDLRV